MKQVLLAVLAIAFFASCTNPSSNEASTTKFELLNEELNFYALSEIDSVYSIAMRVKAKDTVVVKYVATLTQELETFTDSLMLDIDAGHEVTGQIIFPNCRVKNKKRPSFTSKITILEN